MIGLLALTCLQGAALVGGGSGSAPNVVVVLLDDVGRDKIGLYGDAPVTPPTPNLDRLAARGVLFRNVWAAPVCSPTRAALLTGRGSDRTGIGDIIRGADGVDTPLPSSEITLAEALPGYATAAIGKWHLHDTLDPAAHAIDQGFDVFAGWVGQNAYFSWTQNLNGVQSPGSGYYPLHNALFAFTAAQNLPEPYFLYYCPFLAHAPFHTPPPELHSQPGILQSNLQRHFAMVEAADALIGRVLGGFDLNDTYVFVVGDNGSPGTTVPVPFDPARVKGSLYEGGVRVPMIVAGPGVAQGAECDELVHVTDYFATIRDLSGHGPVSQGAEDSVSFAHLLGDPALNGGRRFLYEHRFGFAGSPVAPPSVRAVRTRRWKLIERDGGATHELYDLDADPLELNDLLVTSPGPISDLIRDRLIALMP